MASIEAPLRKVLVLRDGNWTEARMLTIKLGEQFRLESTEDDLTCPDGTFIAIDNAYINGDGIGEIVGKPMPNSDL
jgi:hypothetical protein